MPTVKRWQVVRSRPVQLRLKGDQRAASVSQQEGAVDPVQDRRFWKAKRNGWIQPVSVEVDEEGIGQAPDTSGSDGTESDGGQLASEVVDSKSEVSQPESASGSEESSESWPDPDTDHEPEIETVGGVTASPNPPSSQEEDPEDGSLGLDDLELSDRTRGVLESKGVDTVQELRAMTDSELTDIKGIGKSSLEEIREAIQAQG